MFIVSAFCFFGQLAYKIVMKDLRYLNQQLYVNAVFVEDAVDATSLTVEFACQPTDGAFLTRKFLSDSFSDFNHGVVFSLFWQAKK